MIDIEEYNYYHGYIAVVVCSFGIISNIINIKVWCRHKEHSAINITLRILSVADLGVSVSYLVFASYTYLATGPDPSTHHGRGGVYVMLVSNHTVIIFVMWSTWIVISLASFRFVNFCFPRHSLTWCSVRRAKVTMFIMPLIVLLISVLSFLYYVVSPCEEIYLNSTNMTNCSGYWLQKSSIAKENRYYQSILFLIYNLVMHLIPGIAFIILCIGMMIGLRRLARRRQINSSNKDYYCKTIGLFVLLLLFTVTLAPLVIYDIIQIGRDNVHTQFFFSLTDSLFVNLAAVSQIIICSINIVIYIPMSRGYRREFVKLFRCNRRGYMPIGDVAVNPNSTLGEETVNAEDEQVIHTFRGMQVAKEHDYLFE